MDRLGWCLEGGVEPEEDVVFLRGRTMERLLCLLVNIGLQNNHIDKWFWQIGHVGGYCVKNVYLMFTHQVEKIHPGLLV